MQNTFLLSTLLWAGHTSVERGWRTTLSYM